MADVLLVVANVGAKVVSVADEVVSGCLNTPGMINNPPTLVDGNNIEYHPFFKLPSDIYQSMRKEDYDSLNKDRV